MYIIQEKYETAHPRRLNTSKLKTDFFLFPVAAAHVYGARDLVGGIFGGIRLIWSRENHWAPISRVKKSITAFKIWIILGVWTLFWWFSWKSCRRILDFPEISKMYPTLRTYISELTQYFFSKFQKVNSKFMKDSLSC